MISFTRGVSCKLTKSICTRLKNIEFILRKQNSAIYSSSLAIYKNDIDVCSIQRRSLFTTSNCCGVNVRPLTITSRLTADRLVRDMTEVERERLSQALQHLQQEFDLENLHVQDRKPTAKQLLLAGFSNAVPFVGFGFLDNAIMIVAGEYIDCTLGCALGISTMAAAAIGNMISDVAGIGLAGYVENVAARFGIEEPHLTAHQLSMGVTKMACHSGRALGIIIGCIIGMFPLLFIENNDHEHHEHHEHEAGHNEHTPII